MVKISTDLKTYSTEITALKFNISDLNVSELEQELEHLIFVEHEESMEEYTHLKPLVEDIVKLMVRKADQAVVAFQHDMTHRLVGEFSSSISEMILGQRIATHQSLRADTTVDDIGVVGQVVTTPDSEVQEVKRKDGHNDW